MLHTRPKAKEGSIRSGIRDKRVVEPPLYIDLRDRILTTRLWGDGKFLLTDVDLGYEAGDELSGLIKLPGRKEQVFFTGQVAIVDAAKKRVGVSYSYNDESMQALVKQAAEENNEKPADQRGIIRIVVAYRTINWSLSGFLVSGYRGKLHGLDRVTGLIRVGRTSTIASFAAKVVRVFEGGRLAAEFLGHSDQSFNLLEANLTNRSV